MSFHSLDYILFLVSVFGLYWLLPRRAQNLLLLAASYFFYGYIHHWFLYLILASTVLDYTCGLSMKRWPTGKKCFLIASLVGNLGMLAVFKYFNFFIGNVQEFLELVGLPSFGWTLNIFLPAGISFYTFQTLSYTIDIYRGGLEPRKDFINFAVFVAFFPQLVAGPIERAKRLIPQFEKKRRLDPVSVHDGVCLMIFGFFKKLVIADTVAIYSNKVFAIRDPSFLMVWAGVFAFYIQIYADFSAYTDIARGTARLLGFKLTRNFRHPYISRNPVDLWQRWHISLSTWLRDYVTVSLHRSRWKAYRNMNIFLTFTLCGLWHGAGWNFILWGAYCGLTLIYYPLYQRLVTRLFGKNFMVHFLHWASMFVLINIGFLLFREHNLRYIIRDLTLNPFNNTAIQVIAAWQIAVPVFIYSLPLWAYTFYDVLLKKRLRTTPMGSKVDYWFHTFAACALFILILILNSEKNVDFIYFQF